MSQVLFWSAGNDGCSHYRCVVPAAELARRGHNTHVSFTWQSSYFGKTGDWDYPDVLVGQRVCQPGVSDTWQKACRDPGIFCVYELDDDLFNIDPSNTIAFEFFNRPEIRSAIIRNIEAADAVTCSTYPLADQLYKYNRNVTVVPNCLPGDAFLPLDRPRHDVGWHGSATHNMDWEAAASQVKRWLVRNPDKTLRMIGSDYGRSWKLPNYSFTDWITPVPAMIQAFDFLVGLAPLRPHVFNRSKSHLKALEYAARGIPTIASDSEPYRDFIQHEDTGILVKRDHEWSKWLRVLTSEPSHARMMGRAAFKRAKEYSIESWGTTWCEALGIKPVLGTLGV